MMSLTGLMNKFLKTILSVNLLFFAMNLQGQEEVNKDSIRSMRVTPAAGKWFSGGINLGFVSVSQNPSSTLLTVTDGQTKYTASFGFVPPLISQEEPNNPPVATVPVVEVFYEEGDIIKLDGSDPDGDEIAFEVTEQPLLGELTASGADGNAFTFKPSPNLTPGNGYRDTVRFKVYETLRDLESEVVAYAFTFNVQDKPHGIVSFEQVTATTEQKTFELSFEDDQFNDKYKVILQYIDLSNPISPELLIISSATIPLDNLVAEGTKLTATIVANSVNFPYLFDADKVFITAQVSTESGFDDDDAFILDNGAGGTVISDDEAIEDTLLDIGAESVTSEDGFYFTFASERITPENTEVELKLFAVELGGFDLSDATIEITTDPKTGTFSTPIIEEQTSTLVQWSVTYTPSGEIGYLDSLEFTVTNNERDFAASSFALIEVVDVNDPPVFNSVSNQVIDEEGSVVVELDFNDPDGELMVTATSADNTNLPVTLEGNELTVNSATDFFGSVQISLLVQEVGTEEAYSRSQTITVEVQPVNDQPVLAAISDQQIDEDNPFTYTLSTSDVDAVLPIFGYSVASSIQGVVSIEIDGNQLTVTPEANYNGMVSFTITSDDQLGEANSISEPQSFDLVINAINDLPQITADIPNQNLIEGFPTYTIDLGQYFEDVETLDADLEFTVVENSALFNLSVVGDQLSISPIAEQSGLETLTIMASDGDANISQEVDFNLDPISADIQIANAVADVELAEDFGTHIIDISAVFVDANDDQAVFTFSTGGLDNLVATINGTNLEITTPADYNGSEALLLLGTTNEKSSFINFNITVSPVNDQPTLEELDNQTIQEDSELSSVFAAFDDIDNTSEDLIVTAVSSDQVLIQDASIVLIKGETGVSVAATPEVNQFGKVTITLTLSDGELTTTTAFDITVNSVNDAPVVASTSLTGAIEDAAYMVDLTTLFTDIDEDDLQYTFENKPEWLVLTDGDLAGSPENDDVGDVNFFITADDGSGGTIRQEYNLTVTNTNDTPEVLDGTPDFDAAEDAVLSLAIANDAFVDVDGDGLALTAAFTGADWLSFNDQINRFVGTPTNDDLGTVEITVTATDPDGASVTSQFSLTIINTNDTPTAVNATVQSVDENVATGAEVATFATTDVDAGDTHSYSLVEGEGATDNASFAIVDGALETAAMFDFESQNTLSVRVRSTDAEGATVEEVVSITVGDVNEVPSDLSVDNASIAENAATGTEIGSLSSVDVDAGDTHTYSLVSGTGDDDNTSFDIVDGKLVSNASFDFETKPTYSVRVQTADADGLTFAKDVAITVTNANEAPTVLGITATTLVENADEGTEIGALSTEDVDASDTHTYALVSGTGDDDNSLFAIADGKLVSGASLNFEERATYSVRIAAEDGAGLTFEQSIAITLTDANDAPTDITAESLSIVENGAAGDVAGSFTTIDEDATDSHTYTLVEGEGSTDNASFEIAGAELRALDAFDFETKETYAIRVKTTDGDGLSHEKSLTVTVTNQAEPSIEGIGAVTFAATEGGTSSTASFTIVNTGDAMIEVTDITTPEGFSVTTTSLTVAVGASESVEVTFSPTEVRAYSGQIVMSSTVGQTNIDVSGIGTIVTGIDDDVIADSDVSVYPNPASSTVVIDLEDVAYLRPDLAIFSTSGVTMFQRQSVTESKLTLDVTAYKAGTYLVRIATSKGTVVKKLMIVR